MGYLCQFLHDNFYLFSITLSQRTLSAKCTYLCKWRQKITPVFWKGCSGDLQEATTTSNVLQRSVSFCTIYSKFSCTLFSLFQTPLNLDTRVKVNTNCHKHPSSSFFCLLAPVLKSIHRILGLLLILLFFFLKHLLCIKKFARLMFLIIMVPQLPETICKYLSFLHWTQHPW